MELGYVLSRPSWVGLPPHLVGPPSRSSATGLLLSPGAAWPWNFHPVPLGNHGRSPNQPFRHDYAAGNHRLDALQAAVLSVKLKRLDIWNAMRRRVAAWYQNLLTGLPVEQLD